MGKWGRQSCEVVAAEPEHLLPFRFATETPDTMITWELIPEADGARLKLTHEGFNLESPMERKALGRKPGWPIALTKLESTLST